jgi:spore coat protein E
LANYKEIVTKTVIGKAKKTNKNNVVINPEQIPNTVLGCWVINHTFSGLNDKGLVKINGSYDVNVWYSYDSDHKTAVTTKTYIYEDTLNVPIKNKSDSNDYQEIIVRSLKQPTVDDVKINGSNVELTIEKEMGVEIVGEGKIKVTIEDDEDDYEEVFDDDKLDEVVNEIDTEYLK